MLVMKTSVAVLRRLALVLAWVFSLGGLAFALGYAVEDPGGWSAAALFVGLVVPVVGLTIVAARAPRAAFVVLTTAVVLFATSAVVEELVDIVDAPVVPVVALVLVVPIAVLGQRRAMRAGVLLTAVVAVPLALVLVRMVEESDVHGAGLRDLLATSTGVVVIPLVVIAALLLTAGSLAHPGAARDDHGVRPA